MTKLVAGRGLDWADMSSSEGSQESDEDIGGLDDEQVRIGAEDCYHEDVDSSGEMAMTDIPIKDPHDKMIVEAMLEQYLDSQRKLRQLKEQLMAKVVECAC